MKKEEITSKDCRLNSGVFKRESFSHIQALPAANSDLQMSLLTETAQGLK